uniref:Odorant receptor 22 n=1 Tax=Chouioia cunea TaxID=1570515 RepID=A0A6B9CJQ8_9HYME|nr:odorant receptor 22 [Chouioia cunea]
MVYVVQLYLCQWTPDHLFDESLAVSTAAYFASVYWMPRRMGKHLLTIIARAQHPVQITAGGFVNLSLQSFGSMLTSAFSFFTLLRKLNL